MLSHVQEGQSNRDWAQEFYASRGKPLCPPGWYSISEAPLVPLKILVRDGGYDPVIANYADDIFPPFLPTHWMPFIAAYR